MSTDGRPLKASIAAAPVSPFRDRCGADDRGTLPAAPQHLLHHAAEELHGHVLERERGTVEDLEQEEVGVELAQRHDGRMAKTGIGGLGHAAQGAGRETIAREGRDQPFRDVGIGLAREIRDGGAVEVRDRLGQVEPAVARETGQQHAVEAEPRGGPACRYIVHVQSSRAGGLRPDPNVSAIRVHHIDPLVRKRHRQARARCDAAFRAMSPGAEPPPPPSAAEGAPRFSSAAAP